MESLGIEHDPEKLTIIAVAVEQALKREGLNPYEMLTVLAGAYFGICGDLDVPDGTNAEVALRTFKTLLVVYKDAKEGR